MTGQLPPFSSPGVGGSNDPGPEEPADLAVVIPAYNEATNLGLLYEELTSALRDAAIDYEIVFVNDGSTDATVDVIAELVRGDSRVRGLVLSRNFGHQAAVSVGLQHARGRAIGVMDADLQDRPEDLLHLYRAWKEGADVAYAVRRSRKESLLLRLAYKVFYRLQARLTSIRIPVDAGDFCVMDAAFVERLNALPERSRFVRGLRAWLGGRQVAVPVDRDARRTGESKYSFSRLLRLAADGIISFSFVPLRLAAWLGLFCSLMAFVGAGVVLTWRLRGLLPAGAGSATIALSVLFLGGVQLFAIGVLGEYMARILEEVKARPTAVVHHVIESKAPR